MANLSDKKAKKTKKSSRKKDILVEASFWLKAFLFSSLFALAFGRFLPDIAKGVWELIGEGAKGKGLFEVTGYCNCGECCGWEYDKDGNAVYNYAHLKGRLKIIGQTSSGKMAKRGTVAADPRVFKIGTKLYIPGYGEGVVEDIGGAIKGRHIDLWFSTHQEAKRWGKRYLKIEELKPIK